MTELRNRFSKQSNDITAAKESQTNEIQTKDYWDTVAKKLGKEIPDKFWAFWLVYSESSPVEQKILADMYKDKFQEYCDLLYQLREYERKRIK